LSSPAGPRDDNEVDSAAQQQVARDETGLNGFAETYVVRDQEVDTGKPQSFAERQKLVCIEPDARLKRRLQQIAVSGCRRSPSYRAKVGRQRFGPVREPRSDVPPSILIEHDRADFGIPEDFEPLSLGIVRDAREVERLKVVRFAPDQRTPLGAPVSPAWGAWEPHSQNP
jgi:hypothetical protein